MIDSDQIGRVLADEALDGRRTSRCTSTRSADGDAMMRIDVAASELRAPFGMRIPTVGIARTSPASKRGGCSWSSATCPRIQRVAQAIADEVDGEHVIRMASRKVAATTHRHEVPSERDHLAHVVRAAGATPRNDSALPPGWPERPGALTAR